MALSKTVLLILATALVAPHFARASVWPEPKKSEWSSDPTNPQIHIATSFTFKAAEGTKLTPTLSAAFDRYKALTFAHTSTSVSNGLDTLAVSVADPSEDHPQLDTDESYTIKINANAATLQAKTVYGAMRGLETFSQLVTYDFDAESYIIAASSIAIDDAPRFPHRGLMIDTARHFETLASIRAIVASLPYAKINVLHWHMSDTQSFPMQSHSHPKLWDASYSPQERYTQADIAAIVEWGRLHGVRVIVEFDMPGHAGSWCTGYPEICPSTTCLQPLNVANNATFDLISDLLDEMTGGKQTTPGSPSGLFPDNFIHLGGDEVDTSCWTQTASVASWLNESGLTADEGYAYFVKRAAETAMAQGRRPVQWSEVYDHFKTSLDKRTIVHIWKSVTNVTEVVANGYNVLLNVGYDATSWYLDNLNVNWTAVYAQDPCGGSPPELCKLILGGHGEMWGETVDMSDLEQTVWPRLGAIAERLWSPESTSMGPTTVTRMEAFRCLLNRRGVHAAPVNNPNARSAPPGPGGCYVQ